MNDSLKAQLRKIDERVNTEDPTVLDDTIKLTEQYPDEPEVWHSLGYVYESQENYPAALTTMSRVIELAPQEPAYYHHRGCCALMAGDYNLAIADFSQGLALCDEWKNDYYRQSLHFLRAEAHYQLGRKAEAQADLAHVDDDTVSWTIQVRSKAELVALCSK